MKSIELSKEQEPYINELKSLLQAYEDTMSVDLQTADINLLLEHLKTCQSLLATEMRVTELATSIIGHVKGIVLEEFMKKREEEEFFKNIKASEFKMWVEGRTAKWESLYVKAERGIKSFDNYNSHLVSCISAEKEQLKHLTQQT